MDCQAIDISARFCKPHVSKTHRRPPIIRGLIEFDVTGLTMMNLTKLLAGLLALVSSPWVLAQLQDVGQVLRAEPVVERIAVQNQVCDQAAAPPQERGVGGAIVGGLAGAVVGSRFGKGHGRDALTVAGAVGGAIAGDRIQNGSVAAQPACRQVTTYQDRVSGYRVTFQYAGREYMQVLARDPGPTVPVSVVVTAH